MADGNGWTVMLHHCTLKTPSKKPLALPNLALAKAIAAKWDYQLDLICATKGTEAWVQKLKWEGIKKFTSLDRTPLYCGGEVKTGFSKSYQNLHFYWILGAGHFVHWEAVLRKPLDSLRR